MRVLNPFCDLYRYVPGGGETRGIERLIRVVATVFLHPGWQALFIFRLSQVLHKVRLYPLSWFLYRLNMHVFSVDLAPKLELGSGAWVPHPIGIVIARDARIGREATIFPNVTIGGRGQPPVLGDGVVVGAGACVLGPAALGDRVCVGANSLVTHSFPPGVTVAGVPAKRIEEFTDAFQTSSRAGRDS